MVELWNTVREVGSPVGIATLVLAGLAVAAGVLAWDKRRR